MKKEFIKKKIIVSFSILSALLLLIAACIYYRIHQEQTSKEKINKIRAEVLNLQEQKESLEEKILQIKKYKKVYKNISQKRKSTVGIRVDDINSKLKKIGEKYNVYNPDNPESLNNPQIKISFPEEMKKGIFDTDTVGMVSSSVEISFKAVSDIEAILFMYELTDSLPGYVVINNAMIKKERNYSTQDLVAISSGKSNGAVFGQLNFRWYVYTNTSSTVNKQKNKRIF